MVYRHVTSGRIFGRPNRDGIVHDETSATRETSTLEGRLSPARGILIGVTLSAVVWGLVIYFLW